MSTMTSQITSVSIIYSTVCSGKDQRKHQSSTSLVIVRGIRQWPMDSPHKRPVTRKFFHILTSSCWSYFLWCHSAIYLQYSITILCYVLLSMNDAELMIHHTGGEHGPFSYSTLVTEPEHRSLFTTLRPRQNERHFADDIFNGIFWNENVWIPVKAIIWTNGG